MPSLDLIRTRNPDWLHSDVVVEHVQRLTVRIADGAATDVTAQTSGGTAVRCITDSAVRSISADGTEDRTAERLLVALAGKEFVARTTDARWENGAGENTAEPELDIMPLIELLTGIDAAARALDPRVTQVVIDAEQQAQKVHVVSADGQVATDTRHLTYATVRVLARSQDRVAAGFYTPGSSLPGGLSASNIGAEAAGRALQALDARPTPLGHFPVVVGAGRGMVLIHEACCHPLEGDEVLRGSVYQGRIGESIAAPGLSISDDPTVRGAVGSYQFDDEGSPSTASALVQSGVLVSYLTDRLTAERLQFAATGNGRRQGYRNFVLPRMSNTVVAPGERTPESIIADTEIGLYAQHVGGGEVVESTGEFVFRVTNGYWIEKGKLTDPIADTTVRGNGRDVLRAVDAVGNDVAIGAAKCIKFGQMLPVGVIGPTLRIRSLHVGGTSK